MMQTKPWDKKNEHHRRFYRIFEALEAARRWELPRTSAMLKHQLESMGGWEDEAGFFHDDTRPIKPIDDASCTDLAAGWEV